MKFRSLIILILVLQRVNGCKKDLTRAGRTTNLDDKGRQGRALDIVTTTPGENCL